VQEKGALCSYCVLFSNNQVGHSSHEHVGFLVSKVFNWWKNAKPNFNSHQSKNYHKLCKQKADNFLSIISKKQKNVTEQLNSEYAQQINQNRSKICSIVKTIILCGCLKLPTKGKMDSGKMNTGEENISEGKFRTFLKFRANAGDDILKKIIWKRGQKMLNIQALKHKIY
jgi:hypothetical protein